MFAPLEMHRVHRCVCININHFLIQAKDLGAEKLTGMVMRVMSGRAKP